MNKYEFFHNELVEMTKDHADKAMVDHYTWMSECAKFRDAVDYGEIVDKDFIDPVTVECSLFLDCDEFDVRLSIIVADRGVEAMHRKHRKSRRMAKVRHKNNDFVAGVGKGFKGHHHCAVRREYDIPTGKSNFTHKVGSYGWHY